ncbi:unnamed protein product [Urochloa humidicola]
MTGCAKSNSLHGYVPSLASLGYERKCFWIQAMDNLRASFYLPSNSAGGAAIFKDESNLKPEEGFGSLQVDSSFFPKKAGWQQVSMGNQRGKCK